MMKFIMIMIATTVALVNAAPKPQIQYSQTYGVGGALGPLSTGNFQPVSRSYVASVAPVAPIAITAAKPIVYTAPVIAPRPIAAPVAVPVAYTASAKPIRYSAPAAAIVEQEEQYPPQPFSYSYDTVDEYGTQMTRQESGDGAGTVRGSYSYRDANGMARIVNYIADHNGFRAEIQTNEPGTLTSAPADAAIVSSNPPVYKQK